MTSPPLNILVVAGGNAFRVCVPRTVACATTVGLVAALALQIWVWGEYRALKTRVRSPLAFQGGHATPQADVVEQQQRDAALRDRVSQALSEAMMWSQLNAALSSSVDPKRVTGTDQRAIGGRTRSPVDEANTHVSLAALLDDLVGTLRDEGQKLRDMQPRLARAVDVLAALPSRWPLRGRLNSGFGRRISPWSGVTEFHEGVDIAAHVGTPVQAPAPGVVVFAGHDPTYGNTIVVDHGHAVKTRFGHLHTIGVAVGQRVERGDIIALSGNTGSSTGPHLHYEVLLKGQPVNPRSYAWE